MIAKAKAICLRYYPFSNTSRIVQWLTPDAGRIITVLKGSQRNRSVFLGQYDVFYTCELVYHARLNSVAQIARECTPLDPRPGLRSDWKASAAASYFCDLVARVTPTDAPHAELFSFLEIALDAAQRWSASAALICLFELQILSRLGLAPRLSHCVNCDDALNADNELSFSSARGGALCSRCRRRDDPHLMPLSANTWSALRRWQEEGWPPTHDPSIGLDEAVCNVVPRHEAQDLLGAFLVYHLQTNLPSRAIALDVVQRVLPVEHQDDVAK